MKTKKIQIAIDRRGNEYFIHDDTGNKEIFRVTRPDGINCVVRKQGFTLRWVDSDYCLKPLIW